MNSGRRDAHRKKEHRIRTIDITVQHSQLQDSITGDYIRSKEKKRSIRACKVPTRRSHQKRPCTLLHMPSSLSEWRRKSHCRPDMLPFYIYQKKVTFLNKKGDESESTLPFLLFLYSAIFEMIQAERRRGSISRFLASIQSIRTSLFLTSYF